MVLPVQWRRRLLPLLVWWRRNPFPSEPLVALRPGDIAIDCGANVGQVTELLAWTGATVYAFEPNPHAFRRLQARFGRWPNVVCINKGVWHEAKTMPLYLHVRAEEDPVKWSNGSSLLPFKSNVRPDQAVMVDLVDLPAFLRHLDAPVRILKMDVEGAECPILERLLDEGLLRNISCVLVETHDDKIPELRAATDAIRERCRAEGLTQIRLDWI